MANGCNAFKIEKRRKHIAYGEKRGDWTYCSCDMHVVLGSKISKKRARRNNKQEIIDQLE